MTRRLELQIEELLDNHRKSVIEITNKMIYSGMIDPESYHDGDFLLAKVLVTAALKQTADSFSPPHSFRKELADINNLKHV